MRDRWAIVSFLVGLGVFCALGVVSGRLVAAIALASSIAIVATLSLLLVRAWRYRQVVDELHSASQAQELAGMRVRTGDFGDAAFVAGLVRPTIYCDHRLPEQLTPSQLGAVLLHERAHQRAFDPTRLLLLSFFAPVLRRVSWGRQWLAAALARREIAADEQAMVNGASRSDLAAALLVLPPLSRAHVAGFTPAVDLRLAALLGEPTDVRPPAFVRRAIMLVIGGALGAAGCAWFLHQLLRGVFGVA